LCYLGRYYGSSYPPAPKPATSARLHELYHVKYSPLAVSKEEFTRELTPGEMAKEELNATEFERGKRSKSPVEWGNLQGILSTMLKYWPPSRSVPALIQVMESSGYEKLDRFQRGYLWNYAKEKYKELKAEK